MIDVTQDNGSHKRRTTAEIVASMRAELRAGAQFIALAAIPAEGPPALIFAHDAAAQSKLDALVQNGGAPVGIISLGRAEGRKRRKRSTVAMRVFAEFEAEQQVHDYLEQLTAAFLRSLEELKIGKVIRGTN